MEPFATPREYEALYGPVEDGEGRLPTLLLAATGYLMSYMPDYVPGRDDVLDMNACTVCCAMVHRALSAPAGMEGVSSLQQTAGSYSATVSMFDQYMRPLTSELEILGVGDSCVVTSARMVPHAAD